MRASALPALALLGLALTAWPQGGRTQADRDFVFTDDDGHLVIRFVGTGSTGLDPSQIDEISNAEFSRMVHDRLRADLMFDVEPRDPEWASSMEPQLEQHVKHTGPDFSDVFIECRAASCRIIMEQSGSWSVEVHQSVLETVRESLSAFIETRREHFEPAFMLTAYYQEFKPPHIKAFLRRADSTLPHRRAGG